jgi:hypothetical protein
MRALNLSPAHSSHRSASPDLRSDSARQKSPVASILRLRRFIARPRLPRKLALGWVLGARFRLDEERLIADAIDKSGMAQADRIRDALLSAARQVASQAAKR